MYHQLVVEANCAAVLKQAPFSVVVTAMVSIEQCENSAELNPLVTEEIRFRLCWVKLIVVVCTCANCTRRFGMRRNQRRTRQSRKDRYTNTLVHEKTIHTEVEAHLLSLNQMRRWRLCNQEGLVAKEAQQTTTGLEHDNRYHTADKQQTCTWSHW